jgi:aspartate/methionine/tyrosine aminotransferase
LFLDLRRWVAPGEDSAYSVLERCAEQGVLLAPGAAFGSEFASWARLCYTAVTPELLDLGVSRINKVLDTLGRR